MRCEECTQRRAYLKSASRTTIASSSFFCTRHKLLAGHRCMVVCEPTREAIGTTIAAIRIGSRSTMASCLKTALVTCTNHACGKSFRARSKSRLLPFPRFIRVHAGDFSLREVVEGESHCMAVPHSPTRWEVECRSSRIPKWSNWARFDTEIAVT